jgi:outer membrane protein TolC
VATFFSYSRNALGQKFNLFNFSDPWFKTSLWGINLNVPIFDGGQKAQRIKQANLNLQKTTNTIANVQRAIDLQVKASSILFKNSLSSLDMQDKNVVLAERVYNTTKKKYEQGLGSSFELLQTASELENAQSNYFQSLYDAINARISYNRALGKL